jgi:uncharacterized protein YndB with AHSA1/START domain
METNKTFKLETSKDFSVPANKLYKAWTEPEQLKQWWKPIGNQLKEVDNDIRDGGRVAYQFVEDTLRVSGEYLEVKEGQNLVYTWNWEFPNDAVKNGAFKLNVRFEDKGNGSKLSVTQENFQDEEALQPHKEGWDKALNDLQNYLEGKNVEENASSENKNASDANASAGYRESPEQQKVGGG